MNPNDPKNQSENPLNKQPEEIHPSGPTPQYQKEQKKEQEAFRKIDTDKRKEDFMGYAKDNREQVITYILLLLGLLLLIFMTSNLLGGLIIGMVAGYYFAPEIVFYSRNIGQIVSGQNQIRYIVLSALLLAFFITNPGIFIGAIIVAVFKQVFAGPKAQ